MTTTLSIEQVIEIRSRLQPEMPEWNTRALYKAMTGYVPFCTKCGEWHDECDECDECDRCGERHE
jgi:hypothetical protein